MSDVIKIPTQALISLMRNAHLFATKPGMLIRILITLLYWYHNGSSGLDIVLFSWLVLLILYFINISGPRVPCTYTNITILKLRHYIHLLPTDIIIFKPQ